MTSRPYQSRIIISLRLSMRENKHVLLCSPTGSGKSFIFSHITNSVAKSGKRIWVIVPMRQLLKQTSEHFLKWKIPHAMIAAGLQESRAFKVHIVSKQTLERRWDKIKNWPDAIIIDECHQNYDFQMELKSQAPEHTHLIGLTATPERLSGEGLSDIYDDIVYGPSILELVSDGYLSPVRYFAPPLEGVEELHRRGTEFDSDELEALFKRRAIYGKVVDHYRQYAHGRPTLVFCRDVRSAEKWAAQFRESGYRFESIDGKMPDKTRHALVDALKDGRIDGLTSCELITTGFDCPRVECVIKLRPTESKALDSQMNGRGMRIWPGKEDLVILDFVNNLERHGHPYSDYQWNFYGKEKQRPKGKHADILRLCPKCFLYYSGTTCPNCGDEKETKPRKDLKEVDGRLVEITGPVPLSDRDPEEKREIADRISASINEFREAENLGIIAPGAVGELLKIADDLGYGAMWVYWKLSEKYINKNGEEVKRLTINSPLLAEIARQKGYKPGWAWMKKKEIESKR